MSNNNIQELFALNVDIDDNYIKVMEEEVSDNDQ